MFPILFNLFNSYPYALQVSDRFHILKNLTESVERYIRQLVPSRLSVPATQSTKNPKMQALYDTRNRGERIRYAQLKRKEGYTINDIALLLHSSESTISKYLSIPEEEVPPLKENARELQHISQMNRKQQAINEVRKFHEQGHSMDEHCFLFKNT
jgi:hypothetical protein